MMFLLIVGALLLYVMTSEERRRVAQLAVGSLQEAVYRISRHRADTGPFGDALRARTPWAMVTPAIILVNLAIYARVVWTDGPTGAETLLAWGASFGPRTTSGEWWRLVTAMFVHGSLLALLIHSAALLQAGVVLERLVGHVAFAAIYVAAGLFATLMAVSTSPEQVAAGAGGAVLGVYGLLLASIVRGTLHRSELTIPLRSLAVLAPIAALFTLYTAVVSGFGAPARAGLFTGFLFGILVERGIRERKPSVRRLAAVSAATLAIALLVVVPLRGVADVRPEMALVVAVEARTAAEYDYAVLRFRNGRITTKALAGEIERTILPELQRVHGRVSALQHVPNAYQPLVAAAGDYLRLREHSWRLRARALNTSNTRLLRDADRTERESLAAFERFRGSAPEGAR